MEAYGRSLGLFGTGTMNTILKDIYICVLINGHYIDGNTNGLTTISSVGFASEFRLERGEWKEFERYWDKGIFFNGYPVGK